MASAALADARAALLEGGTTRAAEQAQAAVVAWVDMAAPYDAATARSVLADALAAAGNMSGAALEWKAAAAGFSEFGARLREAAVRARLDALAPTDRPMSVRSADHAELTRKGDHWEVGFRGRTAVLADLKGIGYLARLLADPGREFHALDLAMADVTDEGLPVLDDEARAAYRRRLAEVEEDIAEAERSFDDARRVLAERDRDYLIAELKAAVGLDGRARTTGSTAERARGAVTRSLRYALRRLEQQHADLGRHLARTVRTGAFCSYQPDPLAPVEWHVGRDSFSGPCKGDAVPWLRPEAAWALATEGLGDGGEGFCFERAGCFAAVVVEQSERSGARAYRDAVPYQRPTGRGWCDRKLRRRRAPCRGAPPVVE